MTKLLSLSLLYRFSNGGVCIECGLLLSNVVENKAPSLSIIFLKKLLALVMQSAWSTWSLFGGHFAMYHLWQHYDQGILYLYPHVHGRPRAHMTTLYANVRVTILWTTHTSVWALWKCTLWHYHSSKATFAYPWGSWSLVSWFIRMPTCACKCDTEIFRERLRQQPLSSTH